MLDEILPGMKPRCTALAIGTLALLLSACGSGSDPDVVEEGQRQGASPDAGTEESDPPESQGQLLESGFGQADDSALAVVLVENTADHGGQTVTVSVNFLDADGEILATESQVDSFNIAGQTIASQVQAFDLGRSEVASIEPTLLVQDDGTFEETDYDLGTTEGRLKKEYGFWTGDFTVENPTESPLESPAVRVACRNAAGDIIGGGYTFPDLVPPSGQAVANVPLTVGSDPASCTAYLGGPIY